MVVWGNHHLFLVAWGLQVESTHPRHSCIPKLLSFNSRPKRFSRVSVGDIIMSYFPQKMAMYGLAHTLSDHVCLSCCILWESFWTAPVRPARQRPSRSLSAHRRLQRSQTMDTTIAPPALNLSTAFATNLDVPKKPDGTVGDWVTS